MGKDANMSEELRFNSTAAGKAMGVMYLFSLCVIAIIVLKLVNDIASHLDEHLPWFLYLLIVVGFLLIFTFVAILYMKMRHAFKFAGKPILILNDTGFIDNTRSIALGSVSWSDVEEILPCEFMSSNNPTRKYGLEYGLGIRFKNRERFVARYGFPTRIMMKFNSGKTYFIIPVTNLNLDEQYRDVNAFVSMIGSTFNIRVAEYRKVGDGQ